MKKIITSTFLLLSVVMYAQDGQENQGFDAQKELERCFLRDASTNNCPL